MKSLLSLVAVLFIWTTAHATQATVTAYQSTLANDADLLIAIARDSKVSPPVVWTKTFGFYEAKETKVSSDFSHIHVSINIEDVKRAGGSDKVLLRCRVEESVEAQTTPPNTNSFQTQVVVKVGGAPVVLGRTSTATRTNSQESVVTGRIYVLTLK